ncbi:MAG: type II toxin-antitoxin system HicA family toxin [Clostridia bacterium]|nr:type II toxin-antitoxin system HicA family toxin [Clostridia bacterium]
MKRCSSREILRILWEHGWVVKNQVGSHVQLVHPARPGKVTVPHPRKELPSKTVRSILKQAGLEEALKDG